MSNGYGPVITLPVRQGLGDDALAPGTLCGEYVIEDEITGPAATGACTAPSTACSTGARR